MRRVPRLLLALLGWAAAISAATGTGYAETMSPDHRDALERGCRQQAGADHIAYYNCLSATLSLVNGRTLVDLTSMTAAQRDRLKLSCLGSKNLGLIAYDDCLVARGEQRQRSCRHAPRRRRRIYFAVLRDSH